LGPDSLLKQYGQEAKVTMAASTMHAVVTGGGGFLGFAVIERLLAAGYSVTSFSRRFYPELAQLNVRQFQGDIRDAEAVAVATAGADLVVHTAAKAGVWGSYREFFDINTTGTRNVIAACLRHNVPRLVYTSSPSVILDGSDVEGADESIPYPSRYTAAYPETKALAERDVLRTGAEGRLLTVALRPHLIWGPRDNHLVPRIIARARRLKQVGAGSNRVDTVYIDNAAAAHILAADELKRRPELSGRVYFISQGEPVYLWEMINRILDAAGLDPVRKRVPKWAAWTLGALMEAVFYLVRREAEPPMTRFVATELATSHWFDISAARNDLGYAPSVSTEEGLQRLRAWLRRTTR
jgi:nucleoside-diphosphate-sugar epimerase